MAPVDSANVAIHALVEHRSSIYYLPSPPAPVPQVRPTEVIIADDAEPAQQHRQVHARVVTQRVTALAS